MRLETPMEELPELSSLVIQEETRRADVSLPPAALLRDLPPPPPPKPLLVESVVMKDRFGRVVEQPALGLTEPTPVKPLPELPPERGQGPRPQLSTHRQPEEPSRPLPSRDLSTAKLSTRAAAPRVEYSGEKAIVDRPELPPRRLFDPPRPEHALDMESLELTRELIGRKLIEFKVKGMVVGLQPGPVVTVYEFQPDPGVPLAKVLAMEEDLALGLKAEKVRIDRIPGKNLVGI